MGSGLEKTSGLANLRNISRALGTPVRRHSDTDEGAISKMSAVAVVPPKALIISQASLLVSLSMSYFRYS